MASQVAQTISDQIGRRAFFMMGARDLVAIENGQGIQWKVGRNAKGVTHVAVTLEPTDTYAVKFIRLGRAPGYKVTDKGQESGVYFDQLHRVIEEGTGLYLSL